ncbi:Elongation factor 1-delta 2 [Nymphaea thermarum]|nr:Elongation factor 1-delta 2 [Nymphaea thermarum]
MEDVYSCIEAEEQRMMVTTEGKRDLMPCHERSALVSRGPGGNFRSLRRCTHCKKTGHTVDYCWDLHSEKKGNKGRSSIGKTPVFEVPKSSGEKVSISADQLRELRAYLGRIDVNQVYSRRGAQTEEVTCGARSTFNPNAIPSLDEPSPTSKTQDEVEKKNEDLSIALRKGVRSSKLVPVGYGIKKLHIIITIVDDLVSSVDNLIEENLIVELANEYIRSCDIVAFNKIWFLAGFSVLCMLEARFVLEKSSIHKAKLTFLQLSAGILPFDLLYTRSLVDIADL